MICVFLFFNVCFHGILLLALALLGVIYTFCRLIMYWKIPIFKYFAYYVAYVAIKLACLLANTGSLLAMFIAHLTGYSPILAFNNIFAIKSCLEQTHDWGSSLPPYKWS